MPEQKAIKWINGRLLELVHWNEITKSESGKKRLDEEYQVLTILKSCVNSRIGVKPTETPGKIFFICPVCNKFIKKHEQSHGKIEIPYCKWCGQKLDWSDNNA